MEKKVMGITWVECWKSIMRNEKEKRGLKGSKKESSSRDSTVLCPWPSNGSVLCLRRSPLCFVIIAVLQRDRGRLR